MDFKPLRVMNNWEILWIRWDREVLTMEVAGVGDEDEQQGKGGLMEE